MHRTLSPLLALLAVAVFSSPVFAAGGDAQGSTVSGRQAEKSKAARNDKKGERKAAPPPAAKAPGAAPPITSHAQAPVAMKPGQAASSLPRAPQRSAAQNLVPRAQAPTVRPAAEKAPAAAAREVTSRHTTPDRTRKSIRDTQPNYRGPDPSRREGREGTPERDRDRSRDGSRDGQRDRTPPDRGNVHKPVERRGAPHHRPPRHHEAYRGWKDRHHPHGHYHYYGPHVWYHPVWSYGVFIYPPPPRPVMIVESTTVATTSAPEPEIDRSVDRSRSFSVGLRGGSYLSGYHEGPGFGDFGMGVAARYRAAEALGFEVAWLYHDNTWTRETERISQPLSASVELFAFPWTRFNPYVFTGVTWTSRNYHDQIGVGPNAGMTVDVEDSLFGPHGGLGLEFGVGQNASVNLETRFIGYLNKEETDISRAGALQANLGFNFYF